MKADESRAYTKGFADGFKRGREDAIAEVLNAFHAEWNEASCGEYEDCINWEDWLKDIAEQMKEEKDD